MKARVHIRLKPGILDPQGQAIAKALHGLGFDGVDDVRQGKFIELELSETDEGEAHKQVDAMCRQLLANPVIESYTVDLATP